MRLKDRVCLITGGAAGIGKAVAQRFAEEGAIVCICDLNESDGLAVAEEVGGSFHKVNVADRDEVQNWVESLHAVHGSIDVLINNAGVLRDGLLVKVKDGELVKQMPEEDIQLRPGSGPVHDPTEKWRDFKRHLYRRVGRQLRPDELRRHQSWRDRDDQSMVPRVGQTPNPGERNRPRIYFDRDGAADA